MVMQNWYILQGYTTKLETNKYLKKTLSLTYKDFQPDWHII